MSSAQRKTPPGDRRGLDICLLLIRSAPACSLCFGLAAKPTLSLRGVYPGCRIVLRPWSMIDLLALGVDVALDRAILGRDLRRGLPAPGAVLPGLRLRLPDAELLCARSCLQRLIIRRILDEGSSQAGSDKLGTNVRDGICRA